MTWGKRRALVILLVIVAVVILIIDCVAAGASGFELGASARRQR